MFAPLLDCNDLSIVLSLSPRHVKRLALRGKIPAVLLPGDDVRFRSDEIAEWVDCLPHVRAAGTVDVASVL